MTSDSLKPEITVHTQPEVSALAELVWPTYREAFGGFPNMQSFQSELLGRHAAREGFRLVTASVAGEVVGFSWGYIGHRGQFWTELVSEALPHDIVEEWVGGHFEFAEMAVSPSFRRRGLGAFLHDHLLTDVGRRCLLSTVDDPNDPAVRLYRRAGWQRLGVLKSGTQVMGRHAETPLLTLVRQDPT